MDAVNKVFNISLIFVTVVMSIFTCVYGYYLFTTKNLYEHGTSTYVASYKDPKTGKDVNPFSLNYYENYNDTGLEVLEWRINGYSDQNMTALYGRGFQMIFEPLFKDSAIIVPKGAYVCDSYDGISWTSMHEYTETNEDGQSKNFWYVSIDGELKAIRLDGTYTDYVEKPFFECVGVFFQRLVGYDTSYRKPVTRYYTITDIMIHFRNMIKSCSAGTGDFILPVVDLGDFIHVYDVDKNGKVDEDKIGDGGQVNAYFSMDVHYDRRGMAYADQSIYGSVAGDSDFNISGVDYDVEYWQSTLQYNIDETDFVARYSSAEQGYYYSLSSDLINELKKYDNLEIDIVFNLDKLKNNNVLGLDYYALNGLEVSSLTITSSIQKDFTLSAGSLKDTGLTSITTQNVNLINLSGVTL